MNATFDTADVSDRIELPGGDSIVLLDRLGKSSRFTTEEQARNVFRVDSHGVLVWQVHSSFDGEGNPFTRLHAEGGKLTAYRWDGGSYSIDLDTGTAVPRVLER